MEQFFENPGLLHIGENILKNLPFKEKVICRLVRKSWKNILDKLASKTGLNDLLQMIQKACTIPKISNHTKLLLKTCHEKWSKFLTEIHTKMENPLISIYIQNLFKRFGFSIGTLCDPLSTFTIIVGNVNMVKFILQNKLYMNYDLNGSFLDRIFNSSKMIEIIQCFVMYLNNEDMLYVISHANRLGKVKFLELLIQDNIGKTLFYAVECNDIEIVKIIVKHINLPQLSEITKKQYRCSKNLLEKSMTIFGIAAKNGYYEILNCICQKVPNPNVPGKNGDTPLHLAAKYGHFEIVKLLCSYKAKINVFNNQGLKPVTIAKMNGYLEIAQFLDHVTLGTFAFGHPQGFY